MEAIDAAEARGVTSQLVVLPTGTGKTVVFSHIARYPMLVLAHREELLDQAADKIQQANPSLRVEIEQGDRHANEAKCDVVVASVPTLGRGGKRIDRFAPDYFRAIVTDEAHHGAAPTYRRIYDYFKPEIHIGFTATPQRGDAVRLTDVFEEVVYYKNILEMIEGGYLTRLTGYRVNTDTSLERVPVRGGDFSDKELQEAIDTPERNELCVQAYQEILQGRRTLVFAGGIQHATALRDAFRGHRIDTELVIGDTPSDDRARILREFAEGQFRVLVNVGVLTEGFDDPGVSGIMLCRPTRSPLLYTQIVGRGTRLHPGKHDCIVVDIADVAGNKKPLGLPTLLGLPPDFDLKGGDLLEAAQAYKELEVRSTSEAARVRSLDDVRLAYDRIDLFLPPPPNPALLEFTQLIWAELGPETYHINVNATESLRIEQGALGSYTCRLRVRGHSGSGQAGEERVLGTTDTIREVFARADKWIANNRPAAMGLLDANAQWRVDGPTEKQLKFLKRKGLPITADLSKGDASRMIDKWIADNPRSPAQEAVIRKAQARKGGGF